MSTKFNTCRNVKSSIAGFSLIELMIAMTLGLILIFGATKLYVDSRGQYNNNETLARMEEAARYAMSVLEPDIRMSNYWGQKAGAGGVTILVPSATNADSCGASFGPSGVAGKLMLQPPLRGSNDSYGLPCAATSPVTTADTITILRASTNAATTPSGAWHICSTAAAAALVNNDANCPSGAKIYDFLIHSYYVDQSSSQLGVPSLQRMTLVSGPAMTPQEIIPGIEDMQVQFGIDTLGLGSATQYIDPSAAALPSGQQIVSVRISLLVREESAEPGFFDDHVYEYGNRSKTNGYTANLNNAADAGKAYRPSDSTDTSAQGVQHFRRLLVSKTIQPRNSAP